MILLKSRTAARPNSRVPPLTYPRERSPGYFAYERSSPNYTREGDLINMTDSAGVPLRNDNTGQRIAMHLLPGEDEKSAAKKLTLKVYRMANRDEMAGFHKRINYPSRGWA
jgi:hypothetical protein